MFDQQDVTHHIQRFMLAHLMHYNYARFRDLRPPKVDTNLFSYHLKLLQKAGYIKKTSNGYTLDRRGLIYIDRVSGERMQLRTQPKIITMLLVQDSDGNVLLQRRGKQPYIDTWTLPYGKLHIDDVSVLAAARREAWEKLQFGPLHMRHVGDCYIRVTNKSEIDSSTLAHVVRFETDEIEATEHLRWVRPLQLGTILLAPAVERIVSRAFFGDEFFFDEFEVSA